MPPETTYLLQAMQAQTEAMTAVVIDALRANGSWAPLVVGLLAFGESVALLSLVIPATAILLACGALIAATGLEFWPIWLAAATGAVVGDWVSYGLGYRFKHQALGLWPLSRHPNLVARGETFIARWGVWGLFAGRFFGPARAVGPLLAGVFAMPAFSFQMVNTASAMVWAFAMLAPGAGLVQVVR